MKQINIKISEETLKKYKRYCHLKYTNMQKELADHIKEVTENSGPFFSKDFYKDDRDMINAIIEETHIDRDKLIKFLTAVLEHFKLKYVLPEYKHGIPKIPYLINIIFVDRMIKYDHENDLYHRLYDQNKPEKFKNIPVSLISSKEDE